MIALATTIGLIVSIVASFTVIGVAALAWCDHRGRWSPQGLTVSITFDDGRVACSARGKVLRCR